MSTTTQIRCPEQSPPLHDARMAEVKASVIKGGSAEVNTVLSAPRCLEWVVTISYWQPEVELSGDEIDHGFEVTG